MSALRAPSSSSLVARLNQRPACLLAPTPSGRSLSPASSDCYSSLVHQGCGSGHRVTRRVEQCLLREHTIWTRKIFFHLAHFATQGTRLAGCDTAVCSCHGCLLSEEWPCSDAGAEE